MRFDEPTALLERPANAFVAGFMGEANRLPCVVAGGLARFGDLPLLPWPTQAPNGPALVFVRPCDLIAEPAAGDPTGCVVQSARHDGRVLHLLVVARGVLLSAAPAPG